MTAVSAISPAAPATRAGRRARPRPGPDAGVALVDRGHAHVADQHLRQTSNHGLPYTATIRQGLSCKIRGLGARLHSAGAVRSARGRAAGARKGAQLVPRRDRARFLAARRWSRNVRAMPAHSRPGPPQQTGHHRTASQSRLLSLGSCMSTNVTVLSRRTTLPSLIFCCGRSPRFIASQVWPSVRL